MTEYSTRYTQVHDLTMTEGNNRISLSIQLLWSVMDETETGRWTGRFAI